MLSESVAQKPIVPVRGGEEERPEPAGLGLAGGEGRGGGEHRPEAAGRVVRPRQEDQAQDDQQRGLDVQEEPDRVDPAPDHRHVDQPEPEEAAQLRRVDPQVPRSASRSSSPAGRSPGSHRSPTRRSRSGCRTSRTRPGPGASPARSPRRSPNEGPAVDRKRDAVPGPGVGVEDHRHQDDRVAQGDRQGPPATSSSPRRSARRASI